MVAYLLVSLESITTRVRELSERVGHVGTKLVYLADLLEAVNAPMSRVNDTRALMEHFNAFLTEKSTEPPSGLLPGQLGEMQGNDALSVARCKGDPEKARS